VHNHESIKTSTLINLSKGEITVNPHAQSPFVPHLCPPTSHVPLLQLSTSCLCQLCLHLLHHAIFVAELTVMGIDFKDMRPSLIAFMTMLNAIDRLDAEIQTALGFELF
jgi:hypothetical protein